MPWCPRELVQKLSNPLYKWPVGVREIIKKYNLLPDSADMANVILASTRIDNGSVHLSWPVPEEKDKK